MKKLLYILFFLLVGLTAIAQETPPSGLKAINAQFYIHLPDSTIWQQKGTPYNWHRVAKYSELQAMGLLYLLKSDSAHYTTRSYFGLNGVKYSDTAAFKKKIDSVSNSGYTTHGYFNKYGIKFTDTIGKIATQYYVEHAPHTWYGSQIFKGNLAVQGALLYVRPGTGSNPYVYADNTTINAVNAADNAAILLNGNSTTLQYNIGSLIGTLHADNMTANRVWQLPNRSDTLATKGMISEAISGVVTNAIKNQPNDSHDSTQNASLNISGDAVFYKGINKGIYNGNGVYLFSPGDSVTYSQSNHQEAYYDPTGLVYQKTISARDTTRITGNEPVQYEQELLSKTTPVNYFDVINKGYADSHYSSASVRDSALNINKNLYDLSSKSTSRANLFVYSKTEVDGLINKDIVYLQDSTAFASYAGVARVVTLRDSLIGGGSLFVKSPKNGQVKNGGTYFESNSVDSLWRREYNSSAGINIEWYGAKANWDIRHSVSGTDSYSAITRALAEAMRSGGYVTIPNKNLAFGVSQPVKVGIGANIEGRGGSLFPYQTGALYPLSDTLFYHPNSTIYAYNGTDGIISEDGVVNYRNQGIIIKGVTVAGTGRNNGHTGINLKANTSSTASANTTGLVKMIDVSVWGFTTCVDGNNQSDSHWIENSHFANAKYGVLGGANQLKLINDNIFYDIDSLAIDSRGQQDDIQGNEIQPSHTAVGIQMRGIEGTSANNKITVTKVGIRLTGTRNLSTGDYINSPDSTAIDVRSATGATVTHANIVSPSKVAAGAPGIRVFNSSGTTIDHSSINKGSGTSTYGILLDGSTDVFVPDNTFYTYATANYFGKQNAVTLRSNRILQLPFVQTDSLLNSQTLNGYAVGGNMGTNPTNTKAGQRYLQLSGTGRTEAGTNTVGVKAVMKAAENTLTAARGTSFIIGVTPLGTTSMSAGIGIHGLGIRLGDTTVSRARADIKAGTALIPQEIWDSSAGETTPTLYSDANISGVRKFVRVAGTYVRYATQTDVAGTATQSPVYNAAGELVPTTVTGTGSPVLAASPALTGTPAGPTAAAGTNTTQLATTAHVFAERTNTATLTNKTLTSPQINSPLLNTASVIGQIWTATNTAGAGGWATASVPNRSHTLFAPTTGGTVNTVVNQDNIINPAGALATLTINLPSSPANNDKVFLTFTQAVTAISYTGGTVVGVPVSASLGSQWFLTYDTGTTTWY